MVVHVFSKIKMIIHTIRFFPEKKQKYLHGTDLLTKVSKATDLKVPTFDSSEIHSPLIDRYLKQLTGGFAQHLIVCTLLLFSCFVCRVTQT